MHLVVDEKRLVTLRKERNLTQKELADVSGLSKSAIFRMERGGSFHRPSTVKKVAFALGAKPRSLAHSVTAPALRLVIGGTVSKREWVA